jgi:hypothetical protein
MSFQSIQYTPVSRKSIKVYARNPEGSESRLLILCERAFGFSDRPEPRRVKELDASVDLLAIPGVIQRPHSCHLPFSHKSIGQVVSTKMHAPLNVPLREACQFRSPPEIQLIVLITPSLIAISLSQGDPSHQRVSCKRILGTTKRRL